MTAAFASFRSAVAAARPRAAVVLGSGLGGAAAWFIPTAEVRYADVPGVPPPTVHGHRGRLAVGTWDGVPVIVCFGRVHQYEGHSREGVTSLVRLATDAGVRAVVLTNAAGGIHPALMPGNLMAIRDHLKWLESDGWKTSVPTPLLTGRPAEPHSPYSARLVALMRRFETDCKRELIAGTYAALTGPCYETPAEIRALRALGADAVGMSTAVEAEAAAGFGLDVVGLSCITNRAAGLSDGPLNHSDVEETARLAVGRVAELIGHVLAAG